MAHPGLPLESPLGLAVTPLPGASRSFNPDLPREHFETGDNPCKMHLRHPLEQTTGYPMSVLEQGIQVVLNNYILLSSACISLTRLLRRRQR